MGGTWGTAVFTPEGSFSCDTMLLLTDGSVLVHDASSVNWLRLTPDAQGKYETGRWSGLLPMANTRDAFASGVMQDGRVYVVGGEHSDAGHDTPLGEIFDPAQNTWGPLVKPADFDYIQGDAPSCVLANGNALFGNLQAWSPPFKTALWDPLSDSWKYAGSGFGTLTQDTKAADCDEETWNLLPDGSVLTVNTNNPPHAERYIPSIDEWVSAGTTPNSLVLYLITDPTGLEVSVDEIGPAILLPDGRLFAIGGTGQTALYTPPPAGSDPKMTPGTWLPGPSFPPDTSAGSVWPTLTASDAPAVLQTNGKVLLAAGNLFEISEGIPGSADYFSRNMTFLEYDPVAETIVPFPALPFSPADGPQTQYAHLLLVPTGQIFLTTQINVIYIYTPDAASNTPADSWRPVITSCPTNLVNGDSYTLTGTQLNGLSQAVSYGDDAQMATNYPLVRLSNETGTVRYMPTSNFSTMGVATGTDPVTADFLVTKVDPGPWQLTVIANGIASEPWDVEVNVSGAELCLELYDGILQRLRDHGPPVTPGERAEVAQQLAQCHREGNLTLAQYETALHALNEINEPSEPPPVHPPPL